MRWIVLALVLVAGSAWSNDPVKPQTMGGNQKAKAEQRGTEKAPIFMKGDVTTQKTKEEADGDAEDRKQKSAVDKFLVKYTGLNSLFTLFLFVVALAQVGLFVWQLRLMREAVADAKDVASAAKRQSDSLILSERAYVKMSHVSPGVRWITGNDELFQIEVEVKNHGRTPADVTDVIIGAKLLGNGEPLPEPFPYPTGERESIPNAFLVTDETFFTTRHFPLRGQNLADAKCGAKKLWIFGHVDYIDTFKVRHRAGYVRVYIPHVDDGKQNNLFYMTEGRYNYDRPRKKGEGNDWGEKAPS